MNCEHLKSLNGYIVARSMKRDVGSSWWIYAGRGSVNFEESPEFATLYASKAQAVARANRLNGSEDSLSTPPWSVFPVSDFFAKSKELRGKKLVTVITRKALAINSLKEATKKRKNELKQEIHSLKDTIHFCEWEIEECETEVENARKRLQEAIRELRAEKKRAKKKRIEINKQIKKVQKDLAGL